MSENSEFIPADDEQETLENRVITFNINDAAIAEVKEDLGEVDAYKDIDHAKKAKKTLTKMRTALTDAHKEVKSEALAFGRRCDAEKNRLMDAIKEIEDPITEQLDAIKNAEAKAEEERQTKIQGGIDQIDAFALDRHDLTLEQLNERLDTLLNLKVDPEFYEERTEDAENAKEVSESKLRIAIIKEGERLEEEAEKARVEAENKELREQLEKAEAEKKERDAEEAKRQAEENAEAQRKADIKADAERKAREKAEREKQEAEDEARKLREEKEERERKEREEAEAAEAAEIAALQAPDKQKLELFAADVSSLIDNKPVLQSDAGNEILLNAIASLIEVSKYINSKSEEL